MKTIKNEINNTIFLLKDNIIHKKQKIKNANDNDSSPEIIIINVIIFNFSLTLVNNNKPDIVPTTPGSSNTD
ncbi:hypothetical protein C0W35_07260 [Photobacterium kishitanii]|nr:hypothetical protein C0W35_07260 [Photobacterium kishitanii]